MIALCLSVKPGQCQPPLPGTVGACIEECSTDADCQGVLKCCSNGCGHTCQSPGTTYPNPTSWK